MDSSRTRFLLRAMRPSGADHDDPTFTEALEQTRSDPELRAWFEHEQAVDRALTTKLREVRAPAELRAQILQGVAVSRQRRARPHALKLTIAVLAAAASLALMFYTLFPPARKTVPFEIFVTAAVRETAQPPALELAASSGAAVHDWLEQRALPIPGAMPGRLGTLEVLGASAVEWQDVRCSLVTMRSSELPPADTPPGAAAATTTLIHLYTIPRRSCSIQNVTRTPVVSTRENASVAVWRDTQNCYIVVARAAPGSLQQLLGPDARVALADARPTTIAISRRDGREIL